MKTEIANVVNGEAIVCPVCGFNYNWPKAVKTEVGKGEESRGHPTKIIISFGCENGHEACSEYCSTYMSQAQLHATRQASITKKPNRPTDAP